MAGPEVENMLLKWIPHLTMYGVYIARTYNVQSAIRFSNTSILHPVHTSCNLPNISQTQTSYTPCIHRAICNRPTFLKPQLYIVQSAKHVSNPNILHPVHTSCNLQYISQTPTIHRAICQTCLKPQHLAPRTYNVQSAIRFSYTSILHPYIHRAICNTFRKSQHIALRTYNVQSAIHFSNPGIYRRGDVAVCTARVEDLFGS